MNVANWGIHRNVYFHTGSRLSDLSYVCNKCSNKQFYKNGENLEAYTSQFSMQELTGISLIDLGHSLLYLIESILLFISFSGKAHLRIRN